MDSHLLYFDDASKLAKSCNIRSHIMGTPTVKETLQTFKVVHKKFENAHEMIQISMVGPIVN